jgi:hypothetical protein
MAMSERLALSFGLGLAPILLLALLNIFFGLTINVVSNLVMFALFIAIGWIGFWKRSGKWCVKTWYFSKD